MKQWADKCTGSRSHQDKVKVNPKHEGGLSGSVLTFVFLKESTKERKLGDTYQLPTFPKDAMHLLVSKNYQDSSGLNL